MRKHFNIFATLLFSAACLAQPGSGLSQNDVVAQLLPDGAIPNKLIVRPESRREVVRELKAAQHTARAQRAQQVAFLLAALNVDYVRNRDYLLHVMTGCEYENIRFDCDDMTGFYLIYLWEHGHPEILAPLIRADLNNYNAAGSEGLGSYFGKLVQKSPQKFLDAIGTFTSVDQNHACSMAGAADGGGLGQRGLQIARKKLRQVGGKLAERCLKEIEEVNKPE